MKKIISLLMAVCMLVCMAAPAMAQAADLTDTAIQLLDSGEPDSDAPEDGPVIGESDSVSGNGIPATPADGSETTPDISLYSDFGDGDATFTTKIRLTVTDRDGNPLAGVVYGLYQSDGTFVQEIVTDEFGVALSDDIPVNTDYYLEEISGPEGFQANTGRQEIILTDVCAPSRIDITAEYDPIMGRIKVIKTDEDGNLLSGMGFYVYRSSDWTQVDDITIGEDGTATTTDLPYGEYALEEYNIPDGLAADSDYYVSIYEHDVTVEVEIVNYPAQGDVKITKTGNDGKKIAGAVFEIYNADTNDLVQEVTTNSSGYVWSAYMPLGNYYAVEKSVPAPYVLDDTHHEFSLDYNYDSAYLTIENMVEGDPGKIKVLKTDDSDIPLSGVTFEVYRAWDSKKMDTLTTGEDGTDESIDLIPGDYYLVETAGKPGYTAETGQIPFTIDGTGVAVEKTVINPQIRIFGKVKVVKQDENGAPIPGVRFGVYCDADKLVEELTTGEDGTAVSGVLNEGDYYLQELTGVDGYLMDTEQHPFSIAENEVIVPVTVTNPRITGSVKVIKTGTDGEPLSGVVFGGYSAADDSELCQLTTGEDGTATSAAIYYGDYYLKELSTVDGYELLDTPIPFSVLEQDVVIEIPVTNPLIMGGVSVYKVSANTDVDGNPIPLANAKFGLYNAKGQKLAELTSGEDGRATHEGLPKGSYYLKELTAPEGFVVTDELLPFSIETQGQIAELTAINGAGFGTLEILKTGEDGELLSGVTFDVFRASTAEKAGELVTDEAGAASLTLPLGGYYLVETATADGYGLLTGKISVNLTADGETVRLPIVNQKNVCVIEGGHIRLLKKDADTAAMLPGASFGIYHAADDSKAGEITTGTDGTAVSLLLPAGDYYLKELRAPENYEISTDKIPVTVTDGGTAELTATNKRLPEPEKPEVKTGTVKIIKTDAEDSKTLLSGAVFSVYETNGGKKAGELLTGKDGTASLELPEGSYTIRETTAPEGYTLSTESVSLTLKAGETRELTLSNKKAEPEKPGTLRVVKQDKDGGKKLKGAVFGIYNADTDKKLDEITTDKKGIAELELPVGDYYLKELEAPDGYELSSKKINFSIQSGKTTEKTVKNVKEDSDEETGTLIIIKEDKETGDPLRNATFGIYDRDGDKVDEVETGKDGTAEIDLDAGSYYLRELEAPEGYKLDGKKVTFKVTADKTTKVTVKNEKEPEAEKTGTLRIVKSAAGTGARLSGAVFALYDSTDKKLADLTTNADGLAEMDLAPGSYYLKETKAPEGFKSETARILFTITADSRTVVEVTNEKEGAPVPSTPENPGTPEVPDSTPEITIPKTGEPFPALQYALALLCFGAAATCGLCLYRQNRKKTGNH